MRNRFRATPAIGKASQRGILISNSQSSQESTFQVSGNLRLTVAGYGGYVPGVKSENIYGQTYGKTSFASNSKQIMRGMDEPPNVKYNTSMRQEFVDHAQRSHMVETTAQIVGVDRGEDQYRKVSSFSKVITATANSSNCSPCFLRCQRTQRH